MLAPDFYIRNLIESRQVLVEPFEPRMLQPASLDLRLHALIRRPRFELRHIDIAQVPEDHTELVDSADNDGRIMLGPGEFILGCTAERVALPAQYAARVEGKSSLARLGVAVHVTGGFIDPGFDGQITLEIANLAPWAVTLRAGMPIAQIALQQMADKPHRLYATKGHYQGQSGPTESRYRLPAV